MSDQTPDRRHGATPWLGAAILIVIGVIFLGRNLGWFDIARWWALVFLIPAVASFGQAWRQQQATGSISVGPIIGGLIFVALTAAFLFGLDWAVFWPVILILVGLGVLFGMYHRRRG